MTKTTIAVRDVDEETFRKFRAMTVEDGMKLGDTLTIAMKHLVEDEKKKKPDPKNLLKIRPVKIGKEKVRWSEEIDEFLYGERT